MLSFFTALLLLSTYASAVPVVYNSKSTVASLVNVDGIIKAVAAPTVASSSDLWVATGSDFFLPGQAVAAASSSDDVEILSTLTLSSSPATSYSAGRSTPAVTLSAPSFPSVTPTASTSSNSSASALLLAELTALVARGELNPYNMDPSIRARLSKRDVASIVDSYISIAADLKAGITAVGLTPGQIIRASAYPAYASSVTSKSSSRAAASASKASASASKASAAASKTTTSKTVNAQATKTTCVPLLSSILPFLD